jgi:hypothetical protein
MKNPKIVSIILFIILTISSISVYSQDLIVTSEGDSLNCKITKIKEDIIYFTFKHQDEIRSTLVPANQVRSYQYNYYQLAIVPTRKIVSKDIYPHLRVAANGGWSYRVAKLSDNIPSNLEQYMKIRL